MIISSYTIGLLLSDLMLFKIYPLYIFAIFLCRLPALCALKASSIDFLFLVVFFIFSFGFLLSNSNNALFYTAKYSLNLVFFHQTVRLASKERMTSFSLLCPIFALILFSFLQLLYSVEMNDLWRYPLDIVNSASSEVINDINKIIGVNPKNIWASQIFFVITVYSVAIIYKKVRLELASYLIFIMYLFIQFYLASRVAQIATFILALIIFTGLLLGSYPLKVKKSYSLLILATFVLFIYSFALSQSERIDFAGLFDLDSGHSGDGFKQRLIIYSFFYEYLSSITLFDLFFGNGVSGISSNASWDFAESNLHNVFFTIFTDYGMVGLLTIAIYFLVFIRKYIHGVGVAYYLFLIPLLFVLMFQYQGFELDILWFLASYASVSQMKSV